MEHEVLVPLSPQALRGALDRPALLAVCLPGFTSDEDGESPLAGRLKLRVGSTSITYRGALTRLDAGADPDEFLFGLDGRQAVGPGSVAGTVRLRLDADTDDPGLETRVTFLTSVQGSGRIEEVSGSALQTAVRRLLDRFCLELAERAEDPAVPGTDAGEFFLVEGLVEGLGDLNDLGPLEEELQDLAALPEFSELDGLASPTGPTADPARRHIVGRSAEEVDHAPPRGRYAPALPARSARSRASARWLNPEPRMGEPPVVPSDRIPTPWIVGGGVALLGGAVILVRALRRSR
ncbi:CoxG family protein [Streptacidiphilus jiangxiensis]|uniref:Carbon monoxide dehydrogenase subunit G n=1 Tax=Streptacidiphilus jiangxiensis TaxID=235985 RepID=A0A1H7JUQ1_STRJI|nr:SRPBCC domain-containing protein [Streptacidiphilus jiangxiensis]SEK77800.1 Carbon monoxide dehydrogenase subunit G [Streptacidiphilus jiangxiensis]